MVVATGEQGGPRRRAHGGDVKTVVGQPILPHARQRRRADRTAEGVRPAETGVVDQHDEHVGGVVGRLHRGHDRPVGNRVGHRAAGHPAERAVGDRQFRAVGIELAHRFTESGFQALDRLGVQLGDRLQQRSTQGLLEGQSARFRDHRDDDAGARGERLADLGFQTGLEPVVGEHPRDGPGGGAHRDGGQQWRREQTDCEAYPRTPAGPAAAAVVTGVYQARVAIGVLRHQDRAAHRELLGGDLGGHGVEIPSGGIEILVGGDNDECGIFVHDPTLETNG